MKRLHKETHEVTAHEKLHLHNCYFISLFNKQKLLCAFPIKSSTRRESQRKVIRKYKHSSVKRKRVLTRACSMPFITTVPSILWKEDLDNIDSVQSKKSAILFCLTSGRTMNLSWKKIKTKHKPLQLLSLHVPMKIILPTVQTSCSF